MCKSHDVTDGAVDVEEVHGQHGRGLRRNRRHNVSVARRGAGGIRRSLRILRIVDAPTRCPSLSSAPWMRWQPRSGSRGPSMRSGRRWCRRWVGDRSGWGRSTSWSQVGGASNTVARVIRRYSRKLAGRRRISAANTARSDQSRRGRGLVLRRTATSWRRTRSSMSLDDDICLRQETRLLCDSRTPVLIKGNFCRAREQSAPNYPGHRDLSLVGREDRGVLR